MTGNVSVKEASRILGKSDLWVREAIASGAIDLGACTVGKNGRRSFYISPKKLYELTGYVWKGEQGIETREEQYGTRF